MKNSLHNKILENIQKENLQPKPRWQFVLREIVLWVGTILSLLLASLALGSFIFQSANAVILPPHIQIWFGAIRISAILIFVVLAMYQIVRIGQGYKRTKQMYVIIGFVIIGIIGSLFFASRITGRIEGTIGSTGLIEQAQHYWSEPNETGLLAGELIEISDDGFIIFESLDAKIHIVDAQYIESAEQNLFIEFLRVKMIGFEEGGIFYPCTIAPWEVRRSGFESHKEYGKVRDGNVRFTKEQEVNNLFNGYLERKNDIIRTNQCRFR